MLRISFGLGYAVAEKSPEDADDERDECRQQHDYAALGFRSKFRLERFIYDLNHGTILGFVDLRELVLLGEQLLNYFVALHVAQTAEVVKAAVARFTPLY